MKSLTLFIEYIAAIIGAVIFSLGIGAGITGSLRMAGAEGLLPFLAYPATLFIAITSCIFCRSFFMRYAIGIVNFLQGEFDTNTFTVKEFFLKLSLLLSVKFLFVFSLVPQLWLLGVLGWGMFLLFTIKSSVFDLPKQYP